MDSKNDSMEDELKFQNQIIQKVIAQMPNTTGGQSLEEQVFVKELETIVDEHEELKKEEIYKNTFNHYEKKKLDQYTIEDYQSLFTRFPELLEIYKKQYKDLKNQENEIN